MENRKIAVLALVVAVILCAAVVSIILLMSPPPQEQQTADPNRSAAQQEEQKPTAPSEPNEADQGLAAIKRDAIRVVEGLIKDFPGNENPLIIMGEVLRSYGDAAAAMEYYEKALRINPGRPDVHAAIGEFARKEGDLEKAIAHWRDVLRIQPNSQLMHGYIGEALLMLNKPAEAIESLEKEIQVTPYSSRSYCLIGQSCLKLKENERAKKNYEAAVEINPENFEAYYGLMTVCNRLGDREKAKEHSEKFKRLKQEETEKVKADKKAYDDIAETQKRLASTYASVAQIYRLGGNLARAEKLLKQGNSLDPENVTCLMELASIYNQSNRRSEAIEIHAKVAQIRTDDLISLLQFGALSVDLKKLEDAEEAFRKAIEVSPGSPMAYQKLALLYLSTNKEPSRAKQLAEKAVELDQKALNYSVLSQACVMNRDGAGALRAIKRALELEPDNKQYQRYHDLVRRLN